MITAKAVTNERGYLRTAIDSISSDGFSSSEYLKPKNPEKEVNYVLVELGKLTGHNAYSILIPHLLKMGFSLNSLFYRGKNGPIFILKEHTSSKTRLSCLVRNVKGSPLYKMAKEVNCQIEAQSNDQA